MNGYDEARALHLLYLGNERGFTEIYNHYAPGVAHFALRLLRSRELAQDLVQEVFYKIWVEHKRFGSVSNFQSYLFICIRNRASDLLKKRSREDIAKGEYLALKRVGENSVDDYIKDRELAVFLSKAIDDLPPQVKRVYRMMSEDHLSQKDIAERLNISQVTVKDHLYSARVFIRQRMEKHIVVSAYLYLSSVTLIQNAPIDLQSVALTCVAR